MSTINSINNSNNNFDSRSSLSSSVNSGTNSGDAFLHAQNIENQRSIDFKLVNETEIAIDIDIAQLKEKNPEPRSDELKARIKGLEEAKAGMIAVRNELENKTSTLKNLIDGGTMVGLAKAYANISSWGETVLKALVALNPKLGQYLSQAENNVSSSRPGSVSTQTTALVQSQPTIPRAEVRPKQGEQSAQNIQDQTLLNEVINALVIRLSVIKDTPAPEAPDDYVRTEGILQTLKDIKQRLVGNPEKSIAGLELTASQRKIANIEAWGGEILKGLAAANTDLYQPLLHIDADAETTVSPGAADTTEQIKGAYEFRGSALVSRLDLLKNFNANASNDLGSTPINELSGGQLAFLSNPDPELMRLAQEAKDMAIFLLKPAKEGVNQGGFTQDELIDVKRLLNLTEKILNVQKGSIEERVSTLARNHESLTIEYTQAGETEAEGRTFYAVQALMVETDPAKREVLLAQLLPNLSTHQSEIQTAIEFLQNNPEIADSAVHIEQLEKMSGEVKTYLSWILPPGDRSNHVLTVSEQVRVSELTSSWVGNVGSLVGNDEAGDAAFKAIFMDTFLPEGVAAIAKIPALNELRARILAGNFDFMPEIVFANEAVLRGANGAYDPVNNRILINSEFLAEGQEAKLESVLMEEMGEAIYAHLNGSTPSVGDVGKIFASRLVLKGEGEIDAETLAGWQNATDSGVVIDADLNIIRVEFSWNDWVDGIADGIQRVGGWFAEGPENAINLAQSFGEGIYEHTISPFIDAAGNLVDDSKDWGINFLNSLGFDVGEDSFAVNEAGGGIVQMVGTPEFDDVAGMSFINDTYGTTFSNPAPISISGQAVLTNNEVSGILSAPSHEIEYFDFGPTPATETATAEEAHAGYVLPSAERIRSDSYPDIIVQTNDTLGAIADKYGATVADIIKANPWITNPDMIYVGQVLNLPTEILRGNQVQVFTSEDDPSLPPVSVPDVWSDIPSLDPRAYNPAQMIRVLDSDNSISVLMEMYGFSREEFIAANPGLEDYVGDALRFGDVVQLPDRLFQNAESPIKPDHVVALNETRASGGNANLGLLYHNARGDDEDPVAIRRFVHSNGEVWANAVVDKLIATNVFDAVFRDYGLNVGLELFFDSNGNAKAGAGEAAALLLGDKSYDEMRADMLRQRLADDERSQSGSDLLSGLGVSTTNSTHQSLIAEYGSSYQGIRQLNLSQGEIVTLPFAAIEHWGHAETGTPENIAYDNILQNYINSGEITGEAINGMIQAAYNNNAGNTAAMAEDFNNLPNGAATHLILRQGASIDLPIPFGLGRLTEFTSVGGMLRNDTALKIDVERQENGTFLIQVMSVHNYGEGADLILGDGNLPNEVAGRRLSSTQRSPQANLAGNILGAHSNFGMARFYGAATVNLPTANIYMFRAETAEQAAQIVATSQVASARGGYGISDPDALLFNDNSLIPYEQEFLAVHSYGGGSLDGVEFGATTRIDIFGGVIRLGQGVVNYDIIEVNAEYTDPNTEQEISVTSVQFDARAAERESHNILHSTASLEDLARRDVHINTRRTDGEITAVTLVMAPSPGRAETDLDVTTESAFAATVSINPSALPDDIVDQVFAGHISLVRTDFNAYLLSQGLFNEPSSSIEVKTALAQYVMFGIGVTEYSAGGTPPIFPNHPEAMLELTSTRPSHGDGSHAEDFEFAATLGMFGQVLGEEGIGAVDISVESTGEQEGTYVSNTLGIGNRGWFRTTPWVSGSYSEINTEAPLFFGSLSVVENGVSVH